MANVANGKQNWDVEAIRKQFPALQQEVNNSPLVYFDNAATTQKPQLVIDAISHFYEHDNANVHRGVHALSVRATEQYENARHKVARYINASSPNECIFLRGATEAFNLVANSYLFPRLNENDEILITHMEHHSNIVPWQMLCRRTGAVLRIVPINYDGDLIIDDFADLINDRTKFISLSYVSNALGTINPVKQLISIAHDKGIAVMLDGAQSTAHLSIDVQDLDCDFYALSGHKMYGPTGIGVLWGKQELLDIMKPYQGGGEMISHVSFESTEYAPVPHKFEAGTPNIAGAIGLGAALDYLWSLDMDVVIAYEKELLDYATAAFRNLKGFSIIGTAKSKVPIISFIEPKIHAHDIGTILDSEGIAVRSGHHCAMPLMDFFDVSATTRMSLSFYNTKDEIDRCIDALMHVKEVFS